MKKSLRTILCLMALSIVIPVCSQGSNNNPWPWNFPQNVKLKLEAGQTVLSPFTYYPSSVEKGEPLRNAVLIFYDTTVKEAGEEKTMLNNFNGEVEMPNALIIPIPTKAKAKKGDVVLTWWQSGSGMQRAIVVDDSNPQEPKVCYLDLRWPDNPDSPTLEEKRKGEQLKPGTFAVLKDGQRQSGAQVAIKKDKEWRTGTLIHVEGDKVLVLGFGSKIEAYDKADVRIIPFKEKIKVGDKVWATWVNEYRPGYEVTAVDNLTGHVFVKKEGSSSIESKSLAEVTKTLE
ncbi:MAG: hypothetical protein J6Y97_00950 [Prevotella sp.]|nr:hypothetical protein [Prevotella sp.]MBP5507384.1 hypothetical protein [Prevotella sp.]